MLNSVPEQQTHAHTASSS